MPRKCDFAGGVLLWAAPEIYSKVADPVGAAEDTYSVAVDILSLGVVVASQECGLPVFEEEWEKNAVAWVYALQKHVNNNYVNQGSELLYLVLDNMLFEDPDERSSADYVNTEAAKLLQSMAHESDDEGSATPKPSTDGDQSVVESEDSNEDSEGVEATDAEEEWGWLGVPVPETRVSQVLETTEAMSQGSIVNGLLWNSGGPERGTFASSNCSSQATVLGTVEAAQAEEEGPHEEEAEASSVAGSLPGGDEVQGDGGQDAGVASRGSRSMRKRSWPEGNLLLSLPQSCNYPPSADQKCAISKGPVDQKRSRVGGCVGTAQAIGALDMGLYRRSRTLVVVSIW
ncbi:hypothetical protein PV05_03284 [Exophiala xenobiotica]|uniref:Protein kinase domain-containing protein n=1 Tax=Exophiala xenobiotica TaxID=348802 RepID=A0A0D2D8X2_9EURO|nr:uncharacterized protein PV05_03284 [Exophiala xenobiotica]KIW58787.1 hypothetical protein PV05_03284 [Exophiala xenobiotica]